MSLQSDSRFKYPQRWFQNCSKQKKNFILRGDSGIGDDFDVSAGSESHESPNEMLFENEILTNKELLKKLFFEIYFEMLCSCDNHLAVKPFGQNSCKKMLCQEDLEGKKRENAALSRSVMSNCWSSC